MQSEKIEIKQKSCYYLLKISMRADFKISLASVPCAERNDTFKVNEVIKCLTQPQNSRNSTSTVDKM